MCKNFISFCVHCENKMVQGEALWGEMVKGGFRWRVD